MYPMHPFHDRPSSQPRTRIELSPDIELLVRGRDPESVHQLAQLAVKAREWLLEESSDDEQDPHLPSKQA